MNEDTLKECISKVAEESKVLNRRLDANAKQVGMFKREGFSGNSYYRCSFEAGSQKYFYIRSDEVCQEERKVRELLALEEDTPLYEKVDALYESVRWFRAYPDSRVVLENGISIVRESSGEWHMYRDENLLAGFREFIVCKNGNIVTFSGLEKSLELWDTKGEHIALMDAHTDTVWGVLSLDNGGILSYGCDNTLRLWSEDGSALAILEGHTQCVRGAKILNDGRILSFSSDRTIRIWSPSGEPLHVLNEHTTMVSDVLLLADGRFVSYGYSHSDVVNKTYSNDGRVLIWSSEGVLLKVLTISDYAVEGVAVLSDDKILAYTKSSLRLFDAQGDPVANMYSSEYDIRQVLELPNGNVAVSEAKGLDDGKFTVWEIGMMS